MAAPPTRMRHDRAPGQRICSTPFTRVGCALLLAAAALPGCENSQPGGRDATSILSAIPGPPSPREAAEWSIDPYDPDKRFRGLLLLANAPFGGERVYVDNYVLRLEDSDSSVRAAAAFALGQHGRPDHVPLIVPLLKQEDRLVRFNAARALQRLHNAAAVPGLLERLEPRIEQDADIRAEAAIALGQYPQRRVLQGLIAALSDERLNVTTAAAGSLRTLTGENFGDDRAAWFEWAANTSDPFAGQTAYEYPAFNRDKYLWEHIPFWTQPPNESPAAPAGLPQAPTPAPAPAATGEPGGGR